MEIEIQNTKEDYSDFFKNYYFNKRALAIRIVFASAIALFFFGGKYSETKTEPIQQENLLKILLAWVIIFSLTTLLPYFIAVMRLSSGKIPLGKKKFTITETGIQVDTKTENVFWNWESIRTANANERFAYFLLYSYRVFILPTKYFESEKDVQSFVGTIQNSAMRVKGRSQLRKKFQLYWWGLLGIIPLIGAIAGLVLLLRGIFDFKDKYLILIGSACILFTVGVFSWMNFDLRREEEKGGGFVLTSKMQLNNLMKDVEFYKMQHGVYPDSLEQATKDEMGGTTDFLQISRHNSNTSFYYKKVGENYYLLSSGIDGIPHTADDIYPTITNPDRNKLGLLRK